MYVSDVDQGDSGTLDGSTMAPLNNILGVPMEALVAISICAGVIVIGIFVAVIIVCCRGKSDDYNADQVTGWDDSGNHQKIIKSNTTDFRD